MFELVITDHFKRQVKSLLKKDRDLLQRLRSSLESFDKRQATAIGSQVYKVRIAGQNTGKSGGYRVYCYVIEFDKLLVPICIYAKNEQENVDDSELKNHLQAALEQFKLLP